MRLKLTLIRTDGSHEDLLVTADASTPIGRVAQAIAERDPRGPWTDVAASVTLVRLEDRAGGQLTGVRLPPSAPLGHAPLASGARVALAAEASAGAGAPGSEAILEVLSGDGRGRAWEIAEGAWIVGRAPDCDIVLDDRYVSGRHARVEVSDVVEIVDLGSANGLEVDGELLTRVSVRGSRTVTVGSTTLRVTSPPRTSAADSGEPEPARIRDPSHGGAVAFNRSPRVEARYAGDAFRVPAIPREPEPSAFPWPATLAPILIGVALAVFTGRALALLFVLMSPVMMVGSFVVNRRARRRARARAREQFSSGLDSLSEQVDVALSRELETRRLEAPSTSDVVAAVHSRTDALWTRRPEHWSFLNLRLGTGAMASRSTLETPPPDDLPADLRERVDALAARFDGLAGAPIVENLLDAGALGCAGRDDLVGPVVNGMLAQLIGLHSPSELAIAAIVGPGWAGPLDWLKWTPHVSTPHSPLGERPHLSESAAGCLALLSALEDLVGRRLAAAPASAGRRGVLPAEGAALARGAAVGVSPHEQIGAGTRSPVPAIVVVITNDAQVQRARLVRLAEIGPDAGVFPIWVAGEVPELPAACRTVVDVRAPEVGAVALVRLGTRIEPVRLEPLSGEGAARLARSLAPVVDSGAIVLDASDVPRTVSLRDVLGPEPLESGPAVAERWRENDSITPSAVPDESMPRARPARLRAFVGVGGSGAVALDLRSHGPHALVAGTTGAGKSEFLQAWVLGLAAEYSPDRLTFLFVDYKGGSAFGECVRLPHCVGLVTDLDPHLVRRALTSLRAELRHREQLLDRADAKDLVELERRGDPHAPPALVLVVDEFAALAKEVPEFVDGVVDLAQRGRSLGIHLILATQRPAGVVTDHVRSNANLRIALRMGDERDSVDVVGVRDAAAFDPAIPGRALARTGPGVHVLFQSAFPGTRTPLGALADDIEIAPLRFGIGPGWSQPARSLDRPPHGVDDDRSDLQRLVAEIAVAADAARIRPPRRPWLDELPATIDLAALATGDDARLPFGLCDEPARQRQVAAEFRPDTDGHIAFIGAGGSGKTVALRALAVAAASTLAGGPVHVYALDFASGGLRMLERLPHVGAVIAGDDAARVQRLLRTLRAQLEERARRYSAVSAASIAEYRRVAERPGEPRILLLVDGLTAFRDEWELAIGRSGAYDAFRELLAEGRRVGIHVAVTADRPGALPPSLAARVPRRVVLRLADDAAAAALGAPRDVVAGAAPPGRAFVDGLEAQIAILGGHPAAPDQADAIAALAELVRGRSPVAAPIEALPERVAPRDLPAQVDGRPVLGIGDETLAPVGFDPVGTLLLSGPPQSGRSSALAWITTSLRAFDDSTHCVYLGATPSMLSASAVFDRLATTVDESADLAAETVRTLATTGASRCVVIVEAIAEFLHTRAEQAIVELAAQARRGALLLVAENEVSGWGGSWPLLTVMKHARRGLLLQPDPGDGELLLRTPLPRAPRSEFPAGRGVHLESGTASLVQLPHIGDLR